MCVFFIDFKVPEIKVQIQITSSIYKNSFLVTLSIRNLKSSLLRAQIIITAFRKNIKHLRAMMFIYQVLFIIYFGSSRRQLCYQSVYTTKIQLFMADHKALDVKSLRCMCWKRYRSQIRQVLYDFIVNFGYVTIGNSFTSIRNWLLDTLMDTKSLTLTPKIFPAFCQTETHPVKIWPMYKSVYSSLNFMLIYINISLQYYIFLLIL